MPITPRRRLATVRSLLLTVVLLLVALVATAPAASAQTEPVGGPQLTGKKAIVDRGPGADPLPKVTASAWVLADVTTDEVLAAKDPHGHYLPASTLKVLTYLALADELDPETMVQAEWEDAAIEGSRVGIVENYRYKVDKLFQAMLMVSGNDAALVLARAAGGVERTLELMNAEAARLQALDTNAVTVNGLDGDGGMRTSAYDMALWAKEGLADPRFRAYVSTVSDKFPAPPAKGGPFEIYTKNRLIRNGYEGAIGIKNGYTDAARGTFIGAAERDGHILVVTLLKADPRLVDDASALLDWGFANRDKVTPVGELVDPLHPRGGVPGDADPEEPQPVAVDGQAGADGDAGAGAGPGGGADPVAADDISVEEAGSANGMLALAGGVLLGLVVAGAALVAAGRRNGDRLDLPPLDGGRRRSRDEPAPIEIEPQAPPTYTSIKVRSSRDAE